MPLAGVFAVVWWYTETRDSRAEFTQLGWIIAMVASGLVTITVLHSVVSGRLVSPWAFAGSLNSGSNYFLNFLYSFADRNLVYEFIWLLPLGLVRIKDMPLRWCWASLSAAATVFALNAYYHGAPGTVGRAIHSMAGPLLSLSAATFLAKWKAC